jgi:DNA-binding GntR family transcriptional regulator
MTVTTKSTTGEPRPDGARRGRVGALAGIAPLNTDEGLPARIADRLGELIINGTIEQGTRLSEPELALTFQTSRTPVREALAILERESLVTRIPRRGCTVGIVDANRAMNIYICRAYLYGLAAKQATAVITGAEYEQLAERAQRMRVAVARRDTSVYFENNVKFHEFVTQIADNEVLSSMISNLGRATMRLRFLSVTLPGRLEASLAWHERLLEALQNRDSTKAEAIVRSFISEAGQAILTLHYGDQERAERLKSAVAFGAEASTALIIANRDSR